MKIMLRSMLAAALLIPQLVSAAAVADPQTIWRLLDYVAVDYANAVVSGAVADPAEYAEMQDFGATVQREIAALPPTEQQATLARAAVALDTAIASKADAASVATVARQLASDLLAAYPVTLAPSATPDLARGIALYATQCADCHGDMGRGDGPLSTALEPKPVNFTDLSRARERSLFGLYQVVTQGLNGTAMPGYASLSGADRWALAFTVGQFAFPADLAESGKQIWGRSASARQQLTGLQALVSQRPAQLGASTDEASMLAVTSYVRRNPDAVLPNRSQSLQLVRSRLSDALSAYLEGDRQGAGRFAVSAYLDGFEPLEPVLAIKAPDLLRALESQLTGLRSQIGNGVETAALSEAVSSIEQNLALAELALGASTSSLASSFGGAFAILLREGLEALLVVVAMLAFLRKAGRVEAIPYVYGGTAMALLSGFATWGAATYLVTISGASREVIEGTSALFAAAVLVFIGIWMHGKSQAGAWQRYIREKIGAVLSRQSIWGLFVLSFVVVYREVFETILFYVALWSQGNGQAVIGGAMAATLALVVIAFLLLRYSKRLPLTQFFSLSALLMALLAVILTGKGIAGLQEADLLSSRLIAVPRIDLLGFYPTMQGVLAQAMCATILIFGFWWNCWKESSETASRPAISSAFK